MKFILGKKIGMTRIFDKNNKAIPVTVVQAGPCDITEIKNKDRNGYDALQIAYDKKKHVSKSVEGHLKKSRTAKNRYSVEFRLRDKKNEKDLKIGKKITVEIFKPGDRVRVIGTSKGKGFAGAMKRHGFAGQPASHGHQKPRGVGSIGCRFPQRTIKGKRMPGHMGVERITVTGLKIVDVDAEYNLLAVSGAIPGPNKSLVQIIGEE